MFTQCPDCRKSYPLTAEQLHSGNSLLFCRACSKNFNVLELLSEKSTGLITEAKAEFIAKADSKHKSRSKKKSKNRQQAKKNLEVSRYTNNTDRVAKGSIATTSTSDRLPWESEQSPININWFWGFIIGALFLVGQLIYFKTDRLSQDVSYRPYVEKLCRWFGCQLPYYENLNEIAVLQNTFTPVENNTIEFKTVIHNQAFFAQKLPRIKLTLLDNNEQIFAQRIFLPADYIAGFKKKKLSIAPDETVEARLVIAAPKSNIGGYNFELIY